MLFVQEWDCPRRPKHFIGMEDPDEEPRDWSEPSDSESSDTDSPGSESAGSGSAVSDPEVSDSEDTDSNNTDSAAAEPSEIDQLDTDYNMRRDPFRYYDKSRITVLDRLHDGGSHLTRLGICLDLETQWECIRFFNMMQLLTSIGGFYSRLRGMHSLTQLRLDKKSHQAGRYPSLDSSMWSGVDKAKDIALKYIELIVRECPLLEYINIGDWSWQIMRDPNPTPRRHRKPYTLRELEPEEALAIELFGTTSFAEVCGLPGVERPQTPTTDDEWDAIEKQVAETEAHYRNGEFAHLE